MGSDSGFLSPRTKTRYAAVPTQSPEEAALLQEQTNALKQQQQLLTRQLQEMDLLSGLAFEQQGLRATRDQSGNITGFERIPEGELPEEIRRAREIQRLQEERSLAALRGELPTDPSVLRELDIGSRRLDEVLRRNLGSGFETSTPGIQARAEAETTRNLVLDASRRGDLTMAEQLALARQAGNQAGVGGEMANLFAPSGRLSTAFTQSGQLAAGYTSPLTNLMQGRQLTAQVNVANAQQWLNRRKAVASTFASIYGGGGGS